MCKNIPHRLSAKNEINAEDRPTLKALALTQPFSYSDIVKLYKYLNCDIDRTRSIILELRLAGLGIDTIIPYQFDYQSELFGNIP